MGSREVGAKRIAVATAYTDVVNRRLQELLAAADIDVLSLTCFNIVEFAEPHKKTEADIITLAQSAAAQAPDADAILISCGGLRTLGVARPLERNSASPLCRRRRRRSGRQCGSSATTAMSAATDNCSKTRRRSPTRLGISPAILNFAPRL